MDAAKDAKPMMNGINWPVDLKLYTPDTSATMMVFSMKTMKQIIVARL